MSNCAIPGCRNQAVAWGLCAKQYMRKRRRGDPNAAFKRGRPLKPRPEAPEMVALRQENAALREEISLAEAQARSAAKPGVGPDPDAAGRLAREVASLKEALARAEAKLADPGGEIEKLQRQPKAARTQAQNERLIWLEPHVLNATIKNQFSILSSQAALPKLVFNARPSHIHGHVAGNRFPARRSLLGALRLVADAANRQVAAMASEAAWLMAMRIIGGATSDAALELQSANRRDPRGQSSVRSALRASPDLLRRLRRPKQNCVGARRSHWPTRPIRARTAA